MICVYGCGVTYNSNVGHRGQSCHIVTKIVSIGHQQMEGGGGGDKGVDVRGLLLWISDIGDILYSVYSKYNQPLSVSVDPHNQPPHKKGEQQIHHVLYFS
jgi:hypothetical protein